MIRTPDQRLRVFISSTIQELADERIAARKAIAELRLIPVLFEIGARPYPPRDVYQAYLAQSDIFIGIYWNSYGWIAPDMEISGLEDEYQMSHDKVRLIYIKKSDQRQDRLQSMITEISNAGVSYKMFSDAQELQELIENDLALLLSEQFYKEATPHTSASATVFNLIPVPYHPLIGREIETAELIELIQVQRSKLVTVLGMGGTGKTRLAIELSQRLLPAFKNGVAFISLASINDDSRLAATIAHQLGLSDSSVQSVKETLISFLSDKQVLLVLDNFEQLAESAELLSDILRRAKDVQMLVTSRKPLYLRAEHIYPLYPLGLPDDDCARTLELAMRVPSVALFIQRARSINPRMSLDQANLKAICILCDRLGGLPLALELAAMRTRHMNPVTLLKGMERTLDILSDGARDLPDRQQSFRATVDWSYGLLNEKEKALFRLVSNFQDGWTQEALMAVSALSAAECLKFTEQLLDAGLIRLKVDARGGMRYDMLQPIEEYAEDLLAKDPMRSEIEERFRSYYVQLCAGINPLRLTPDQHKEWVTRVAQDYENFRQAFRYAIALDRKAEACSLINTLSLYWMRDGYQNEGLRWIMESNLRIPDNWKSLPKAEVLQYAITMLISGAFKFFPADFINSRQDLQKGKEMFEWLGYHAGDARCCTYLGLVALSTGDIQGMQYFKEGIEKGKAGDDIYSVLLSSTFEAEVLSLQHQYQVAITRVEGAEKILSDYTNQWSGGVVLDDVSGTVFLVKGNVYSSQGEFTLAKQAYIQSIHNFEQAGMKSVRGFGLMAMGFIYLQEGDFAQARYYAFKALNESRETGDKIISLLSMRCLAALLLLQGNHDMSIRFLDEIDSHADLLRYSSWSADVAHKQYIRKELKTRKGIDYPFAPHAPKLSFDELVTQLTKVME